VADDTYSTPDFTDIQFSRDGKYLLMQVYEGFVHFVVVSLETGQSTPLVIPHLDPFHLDDNYLGDPSFFSCGNSPKAVTQRQQDPMSGVPGREKLKVES